MRHSTINRYINFCRLSLVLAFGSIFPISQSYAETVTVNVAEIQSALDNANQGADSIASDVLAKISRAISDSDFGLVNGELVYSSSDENVTVEGGCNRTVILQMDTDITLDSDTSLSLSLESLYDPVVIQFNVSTSISSVGAAQQILGIRLGECQNLARDSFNFEATGPASFSIDATLQLNPEWTGETTLSLYPTLSLEGELTQFSLNVEVDDTVLSDVLESYIKDLINEVFSNTRLVQELANLEGTANDSLFNYLEDGRVDIELPEPNDEQIIALYQLLQPDSRFPISLDMIRANRQQILASALFGEPSFIQSILADSVVCQSASALLNQNSPAILFSMVDDQCEVMDVANTSAGNYWVDENCISEIEYQPTSVSEYCAVALDKQRLGNAADISNASSVWTHSPGTRFDVGALSLENLKQPLMRRYNYKTVQTHRGVCELEMRVYSDLSHIEPQKPLLALHGGSWQHRASGYIGVEATATQFTNNGFMVFAPFYRLIGESDGNFACNDANLPDILSDVNDALDWVVEHSNSLGLIGNATVFGQSAGGHLALSLAVNRPDDIRRAVLLYAPTDFKDFAQQMTSGAYTNQAGLKILETVTGNTISDLDTSSVLVVENSFPAIIAPAPSSYPPMFILHGEMDSLLPFRQSVRLCNALSGSDDPNDGPASLVPNLSELSSVTSCSSNGSTLHLIAEGEHALDLCIAPELCLSGSEQSADLVAQSMSAMLDWASADSVDVTSASESSSWLGRSDGLLLLFMLASALLRFTLIAWTKGLRPSPL